jgi:hypothetical protein
MSKEKMVERFVNEYLVPISKGKFPAPVGLHITWDMFCILAEVVSQQIKLHGWENCKRYIDTWYTRIDDATTRK